MGPVMRTAGNGVELVPMNFSFPPIRPARRSDLQFQVRGTELREEQPLPYPRIGVLRIHRQEVSEGEAPLHAQRCAFHGDRWTLARD